MPKNKTDWIKLGGFVLTLLVLFTSIIMAYSDINFDTTQNAKSIENIKNEIKDNSTKITEQDKSLALIIQELGFIRKDITEIKNEVKK